MRAEILRDAFLPGIAQVRRTINLSSHTLGFCQQYRRPLALVAGDIPENNVDLNSFNNLNILPVESSETTKSVAFREAFFLQHQSSLESMDALIVVGGGTVLNLGTALAALLAERMLGHLPSKETLERPPFHLIVIPTTVLSMADAAYGSAGLLNDGALKNALNIKFDPDRIVLNRDYLATLPIHEKKRGLIECLKHALLQGETGSDKAPTIEECFSLLKAESPDNQAIFSCILKTIKARAQIAEAVNAGNEQAGYLPSYGHLDVEPREVASHYQLAHGDAVLFGLALETSLSGLADVSQQLLGLVPHTPLAANLHFLKDEGLEDLRQMYRLAARPRFRTEKEDFYKAICLTKVGQFANLEANTPIPFAMHDFEALYAKSSALFSSIHSQNFVRPTPSGNKTCGPC